MTFKFYISNRKDDKLVAISFEFKGKQYCSSDIRNFMGVAETSVHFKDTSDSSEFQKLMTHTTESLGDNQPINSLVTLDIPDAQVQIDYEPYMISGIYIPTIFIPTLEVNS